MFNLLKLFTSEDKSIIQLTNEQIAEFLKINPEKLQEFTKFYQSEILSKTPTEKESMSNSDVAYADEKLIDHMAYIDEKLIDQIVDELLALTSTWSYKDGEVFVESQLALPSEPPVSAETVNRMDIQCRPQCTGTLMSRDINEQSANVLLYHLKKMTECPANSREFKMYYHLFRQGLDILDLDPITYEILSMNQNSMGNWLPQLVSANKGFFQIPNTTIAKVPITLLQLTRKDYETLNQVTKQILNKWAMKAFQLDVSKDYFVKTGTYSSKFDFRNCKVTAGAEVMELGEYLMYIHFSANQMASPLCFPCIYGVSTTNEWVVRDYVHSKTEYPVIYKGLPLRTEFRVFVDCDEDKVLGICPYWEPETMKKRFEEHRDNHDDVDEITFKAYESKLMACYDKNKDLVCSKVQELLPDLNLSGQWSIDIMTSDDDFWLIDMALAERSAFYEKVVPVNLRRPTPENWIPNLR